MDRLISILTYLLKADKVTAKELAQRFEVSVRTILRDIEAINMAGIPIVTTRGGDGGISIMDGYRLDRSVLTADELSSILTGLKGLRSVLGGQKVERLIGKLTPENQMISFSDHIQIDLASFYKNSLSEKFELIQQAIEEKRLLSFDYFYEKGEMHRKVEPYLLRFQCESWYLYAWCCDRQDFRLFKLNRLWKMKIKDETYRPKPFSNEKESGKLHWEKPFQVKLLFHPSVRFRLIEEYGLTCYTQTPEGLMMELGYDNHDYTKSWILGFGDKVKVLAPKEFQDEIKECADNILKNYQ